MTVLRPLACLLVCALLLAAPLPARAQDNPIVQRMQAFAAAYNAGDAAAVGAFYTEDGALLPPRAAILSGRAAIAGHYAKAFKAGAANLRLNILEIRQLGPAAAVEIGETLVDSGGRTLRGRYLHVWTRRNGQWYLSRDMYHVLAMQ